MNSRVRLFPFGNKTIVVVVGVTLFQREVLETKAVGGASTVKVEAVVCTTLTARSEPYNRKGIHATNLKQRADARWNVITANDVTARNCVSQR
jgi:translation initiation factor 6 (eIF-6)